MSKRYKNSKLAHIILFCFTILFSVSNVSLHALRKTANSISASGQEIKELLNKRIYFAKIEANNVDYYFDVKGNFVHENNNFSDSQFETLKKQNDYLIEFATYHNKYPVSLLFNNTLPFIENKSFEKTITPEINMILLPKNYKEDDDLFLKDERFVNSSNCRLPLNNHEVALTDLIFDFYKEYGFIENGETSPIIINTPDDLIGKRIDDMEIVGIYSTPEDKTILSDFLKQKESNLQNGCHLSSLLISFNSEDDASLSKAYLTTLPKRYSDCLKYLSKFSHYEKNGHVIFGYKGAKIESAFTDNDKKLKLMSQPESHIVLACIESASLILVVSALLINRILYRKKKLFVSTFHFRRMIIKIMICFFFIALITFLFYLTYTIILTGFNGPQIFLHQFLNALLGFILLNLFYGVLFGISTYIPEKKIN